MNNVWLIFCTIGSSEIVVFGCNDFMFMRDKYIKGYDEKLLMKVEFIVMRD